MTTTSNLLDGAIEAVVRRVLEAQLGDVHTKLDRLNHTVATVAGDAAVTAAPAVRFISMETLCERLSINRTTALRWERMGKLPQRCKFPSGRLGWRSDEIDKWFDAAMAAERDPKANADRVARIKPKH